jgi:hypothetical protein
MRFRWLKYFLPVLVGSVVFNISSFFETKADYYYDGYKLEIGITPLRLHPSYVLFYIHWARTLVLGIIPGAMLIFFYYKIYRAIMQPSKLGKKNQDQAGRKEEQNLPLTTKENCNYLDSFAHGKNCYLYYNTHLS